MPDRDEILKKIEQYKNEGAVPDSVRAGADGLIDWLESAGIHFTDDEREAINFLDNEAAWNLAATVLMMRVNEVLNHATTNT